MQFLCFLYNAYITLLLAGPWSSRQVRTHVFPALTAGRGPAPIEVKHFLKHTMLQKDDSLGPTLDSSPESLAS